LTGRTARRRVVRVTLPSDGFPGGAGARPDLLAAEEPLGIRVDGSALTVTMRTPGDDVELAAGFLVGEGVVRSPDDVLPAASLESGRTQFLPAVLASLPDQLRQAQRVSPAPAACTPPGCSPALAS
jgi:formate dehydrogenase assembly factor FdhD